MITKTKLFLVPYWYCFLTKSFFVLNSSVKSPIYFFSHFVLLSLQLTVLCMGRIYMPYTPLLATVLCFNFILSVRYSRFSSTSASCTKDRKRVLKISWAKQKGVSWSLFINITGKQICQSYSGQKNIIRGVPIIIIKISNGNPILQ